jgi:hypothetical protein
VKVGNSSSIQPYATSEIGVFPTGFPYGQLGSYIINQRPTDKNIRPEFVTTKEGNISIGLFNNRITIDGSAYIKHKRLDHCSYCFSASGLATSQSNIGDMTTKGIEIDLGLVPIKTESFKWDLHKLLIQ